MYKRKKKTFLAICKTIIIIEMVLIYLGKKKKNPPKFKIYSEKLLFALV